MPIMSDERRDFLDMKPIDHALTGEFNDSLGEAVQELRNGVDHVHQQPFKPLTDEQIQGINDHVTRLLQRAKRRRGRRRSPDTDIILGTLRKMAWAKAKAELESMLETYWSMGTEFEEIETEILGFIERMEDRL